MRIQEMKSGLVHLKKGGGEEAHNVFYGVAAAHALAQAPEGESSFENDRCELDEPRWSVVSFGRREASGLTHREATDLMGELYRRGVAGLCIVTDEGAARVG